MPPLICTQQDQADNAKANPLLPREKRIVEGASRLCEGSWLG
jgi:hypothetical protein